jgi:hypothetical protein
VPPLKSGGAQQVSGGAVGVAELRVGFSGVEVGEVEAVARQDDPHHRRKFLIRAELAGVAAAVRQQVGPFDADRAGVVRYEVPDMRLYERLGAGHEVVARPVAETAVDDVVVGRPVGHGSPGTVIVACWILPGE